MVWWIWFRRQRARVAALGAGRADAAAGVRNILGEEIFFGLVPHAVAVQFMNVSLVLRLLFFALLLWVVIQGHSPAGRWKAGWFCPGAVAGDRGFRDPTQPSPYPDVLVSIRHPDYPCRSIANLLVAVVIALLLLRRLLQSVKRQRLMALDVKQAQEVQQVILPEARMALPGAA